MSCSSPSILLDTDESRESAMTMPTEDTKPTEPTQHFKSHIYLDRWKLRSLQVTAPAVVTKVELERIKGWLSTVFIIEDDSGV